MFCPECGQPNTDDSKFCTTCGKPIKLITPQPSSPSLPPGYVYAELKESGAVTAMSVIGFILGLIGMMGSFIPCIGSLAFFIGIPAALISVIALGIAYSQNAKKTFVIVALTISLIGVVISGLQYFTIISAGKSAERELRKMFNTEQQRVQDLPNTSATNNSLPTKFCGLWEYEENGAKTYIKITEEGMDKFKFSQGYKYEGQINWTEPMLTNADGIYLRPINGKLEGEFVSMNFYPTHGMDFNYKITLEMKTNNKMLYSVWSSIRGENDIREATKISS